MRVGDAARIDVAIHSILIGCAGIIGNFDATCLPRGVVVDVEIACFVEAMMEGSNSRLSEVIMDVCEAVPSLRLRSNAISDSTHTVTRRSSPGNGGIIVATPDQLANQR